MPLTWASGRPLGAPTVVAATSGGNRTGLAVLVSLHFVGTWHHGVVVRRHGRDGMLCYCDVGRYAREAVVCRRGSRRCSTTGAWLAGVHGPRSSADICSYSRLIRLSVDTRGSGTIGLGASKPWAILLTLGTQWPWAQAGTTNCKQMQRSRSTTNRIFFLTNKTKVSLRSDRVFCVFIESSPITHSSATRVQSVLTLRVRGGACCSGVVHQVCLCACFCSKLGRVSRQAAVKGAAWLPPPLPLPSRSP